jgi:sigma-B regulation protein RsbU (phosphoserine phosphatase)
MASLPPVNLGVILFLSFLAVWASRKPIERRVVLPATQTSQPKRQFIMDLSLCLIAGMLATIYNMTAFGFPLGSGIKLMIGYAVAGFFLSLDMALAREREVIKESIASDDMIAPPERLYPMTRKFSLVALATAVLVSIVVILIFSLDIVWLTEIEQNDVALNQAQMSIALEIFFVFIVLLFLVVNLIISYSGNLRLLFTNETRILERISRGDLSQKVPVATKDEFGVIAGHTNSMIDGLRHRAALLSALKLAEEVQQNLLPQRAPQMSGLDIAGTSIYCDETGGDYYDYFKLPADRLGVVVADASGHGVGAAMHMTTVRAFLHFGIRTYQNPARLLTEINYYVTRDSSETNRFMSMFFLEVDQSAKTLCWVRAGHEPAMVFGPSGSKLQDLYGQGIALGVIADYNYAEYTLQGWESGSVIVIGTDGVREARNQKGEMFGLGRLQEVISQNVNASAEVIQNSVIGALRTFQADARQEDDITLVIVKFL